MAVLPKCATEPNKSPATGNMFSGVHFPTSLDALSTSPRPLKPSGHFFAGQSGSGKLNALQWQSKPGQTGTRAFGFFAMGKKAGYMMARVVHIFLLGVMRKPRMKFEPNHG
jgi:hypothetical protein